MKTPVTDKIAIIFTWLFVAVFLFAIGGCNYAVWRAEHPQAATWTFFFSNR